MKHLFARPTLILTLGDDGIIVVPFDIEDAMPFFVPADNRMAAQQVVEFVATHPEARIILLADSLAQDYRTDTLPKLSWLDRRKLLERRLRQTFPAARLTAKLLARHDKQHALLIGVHESNPVFPWAERLRDRLPSIALLPVEGAPLASRLMPEAKGGWGMLVTRQKSGGYRQIVTFKGALIFTRLTPLPALGTFPDESAIIARDIKASLDYLARQGLKNPGNLSVLILMPGDIHEATALAALSLKAVRSLSPAQAARALELPFGPEDNEVNSDIVFAAFVVSRPWPRLSLRTPDIQDKWLDKTIQRNGYRFGVGALALVVAITLFNAGDLITTLYRAQKESYRLNVTLGALQDMRRTAGPDTEPLGRMRQALERRHIFQKPTATPWSGLTEIGNSLNNDFKIVRLEWTKPTDDALERFTLAVRMAKDMPEDRASIVAAFSDATRKLGNEMPAYAVELSKPPFPALPQDSITAGHAKDVALGEITLQRKAP